MIGRQRRVGGALGQLHRLLAVAGDIVAGPVVAADAAHIADVVAEQREDEVQPVARADAALAQVPAAQHLLAEQGDADGVAEVVIGRVAVGDQLERHTADIVDDAGIVGLEVGVGADVALMQLAHERIDHDGGRIEHDPFLPSRKPS